MDFVGVIVLMFGVFMECSVLMCGSICCCYLFFVVIFVVVFKERLVVLCSFFVG